MSEAFFAGRLESPRAVPSPEAGYATGSVARTVDKLPLPRRGCNLAGEEGRLVARLSRVKARVTGEATLWDTYFCAHSTQIPSSSRQPSQCARRHSRHSWIKTTSSFSLGMPHATQAKSPAIWVPPFLEDGLVWGTHTGARPQALLLDSLGTPLLPSPG